MYFAVVFFICFNSEQPNIHVSVLGFNGCDHARHTLLLRVPGELSSTSSFTPDSNLCSTCTISVLKPSADGVVQDLTFSFHSVLARMRQIITLENNVISNSNLSSQNCLFSKSCTILNPIVGPEAVSGMFFRCWLIYVHGIFIFGEKQILLFLLCFFVVCVYSFSQAVVGLREVQQLVFYSRYFIVNIMLQNNTQLNIDQCYNTVNMKIWRKSIFILHFFRVCLPLLCRYTLIHWPRAHCPRVLYYNLRICLEYWWRSMRKPIDTLMQRL